MEDMIHVYEKLATLNPTNALLQSYMGYLRKSSKKKIISFRFSPDKAFQILVRIAISGNKFTLKGASSNSKQKPTTMQQLLRFLLGFCLDVLKILCRPTKLTCVKHPFNGFLTSLTFIFWTSPVVVAHLNDYIFVAASYSCDIQSRL